MCTADTDSEFWRGMSPPAPSSLDSKLREVTRWRTLNEHQRKMSRMDMKITIKCTTRALVCIHLYFTVYGIHTYLMLSAFTLATVTGLLAVALMLQPHPTGNKVNIYSKATR